MTRIMNNEKKECIFNWFVEKYSYCSKKNGELIRSPDFTADFLKGTVWYIVLYPRGYLEKGKGCVSLFLARSLVDAGPENFPLKFELSVLAADGSALVSKELEHTFPKGIGHGVTSFLQIDELLLKRILPQDVLCLRCKLWKGEGKLQQATQISARTRIGIQQISFLHIIEGFSTFEPNKKVEIQYPLKKECVISSCVYLSEGYCCEEKIMVEITPSNTNQVLSKCKFYVLNASGTVINCGDADNRFDATRKDIKKIPLSLTRQVILNRKNEFLQDEKLSLVCDCIFSSGVEYNQVEKICHAMPFAALNQLKINDQNDIYNAAEKWSTCLSALDNLKSIYNNRVLTNVELKTETKSFPAHNVVLCARSPIFKTMLTNDMKEKYTHCIEIDDIEDDILQQLLLFLYSDKLEDLHWESAIKLYYAADKYEVEKLKVICSSFLVSNVSISTASELLLLADTHSDSDLKNAAEDFIFKNEEQVFSSREWENLTETNSQLVCKTMLLKYKTKTLATQQ